MYSLFYDKLDRIFIVRGKYDIDASRTRVADPGEEFCGYILVHLCGSLICRIDRVRVTLLCSQLSFLVRT